MTQPVRNCAGCGLQLAPSLVVCPACHTLVHRERLQTVAKDAEWAEREGDHARAAMLWREALPLLPRNSKQHDEVARRVEELTASAQRSRTESSRWKAGGVGAVVIALVTKGKLLLVGLLKLPTLLSMLAFAGVYWSIWGWKLAVAIVVGIYIHEMGHVAALTARGLPASAPMFVPGLGAFVRLHAAPISPREDARIGLAGPLWGLGAAAAAVALYVATRSTFWAAAAHTTAVINLFNLTAVWDLDGSRGIRSQSTKQRWLLLGVLAVTGAATREGMLLVVALALVWRAWQKDAPASEDWGGFARFAALIVVLSAISAAMAAIAR